MFIHVIEARYVSDYKIWLKFDDQVEGIVDLENELWGEVFEPLKDKELFKQFHLEEELRTITWPTGADLAPEFLHEKVLQAK